MAEPGGNWPYIVTDGVIASDVYELVAKKKKAKDENGKDIEVKQIDSVLVKTQRKDVPPRVSDTELEIQIGNFIYQWLDVKPGKGLGSLSQFQVWQLSACLELKQYRAVHAEISREVAELDAPADMKRCLDEDAVARILELVRRLPK